MALLSRLLNVGKLTGTIFTLEKAGDVFPTHQHTPENVHITVLASGSVRCMGRPEIEGKVLTQGHVYDWNPYEDHGFVALEDNTILVNIQKN